MDIQHITMQEKLNDGHINHSQKILRVQFPKLNGLYIGDTIPGQAIQAWHRQLDASYRYIAFRGITGSLQPSIVMMV